ncbi:uncharacterized protein [Dermacentor andersoni]
MFQNASAQVASEYRELAATLDMEQAKRQEVHEATMHDITLSASRRAKEHRDKMDQLQAEREAASRQHEEFLQRMREEYKLHAQKHEQEEREHAEDKERGQRERQLEPVQRCLAAPGLPDEIVTNGARFHDTREPAGNQEMEAAATLDMEQAKRQEVHEATMHDITLSASRRAKEHRDKMDQLQAEREAASRQHEEFLQRMREEYKLHAQKHEQEEREHAEDKERGQRERQLEPVQRCLAAPGLPDEIVTNGARFHDTSEPAGNQEMEAAATLDMEQAKRQEVHEATMHDITLSASRRAKEHRDKMYQLQAEREAASRQHEEFLQRMREEYKLHAQKHEQEEREHAEDKERGQRERQLEPVQRCLAAPGLPDEIVTNGARFHDTSEPAGNQEMEAAATLDVEQAKRQNAHEATMQDITLSASGHAEEYPDKMEELQAERKAASREHEAKQRMSEECKLHAQKREQDESEHAEDKERGQRERQQQSVWRRFVGAANRTWKKFTGSPTEGSSGPENLSQDFNDAPCSAN